MKEETLSSVGSNLILGIISVSFPSTDITYHIDNEWLTICAALSLVQPTHHSYKNEDVNSDR